MDKGNVQNIYNLSPLQKGILFHYLSDQSVAYNEMLSITMDAVNNERFLTAWHQVIEEYDVLRTVFRWEKLKAPVQIVQKTIPSPVDIQYFKDELDEEYKHFKEQLLIEGVDLKTSPFKVYLCVFESGKYVMLMFNHHIILDGWSTSLILNRFFDVYMMLDKQMTVSRQSPPSYHEYIKYLKKYYDVDKEFWYDFLNGCHFVQNESVASKYDQQISDLSGVVPELTLFMQKNHLTLSSIFHGIFLYLESRLENTLKPVIGTVVSGRPEELPGVNSIAGLMINTLPVTIDFSKYTTMTEVSKGVQTVFSNYGSQSLIHLSDIQEVMGVNRSDALFNKMLVIENYPLDMKALKDHPLEVMSVDMTEQTNFDLTIIVKQQEKLTIEYIYAPDVYSCDDVKIFHERMLAVLQQLMVEKPLRKIDILLVDEKEKLLNQFNETKTPYALSAIGEYFTSVSSEYSDKIALEMSDQMMTYKMLDRASTKFAGYLLNEGLMQEELVGVSCDRSIEMIVAILGIVKAGGAYVPIDKTYPEERKSFIVRDAGIRFLIHHDSVVSDAVFNIDADTLLDLGEHDVVLPKVESHHLAYCIYTSGSTGLPKGVLVEHRSVMRLLTSRPLFAYDEVDVMLQTTALSFDVSTFDIWGGLFHGMTLRLIDKHPENIALGIQLILKEEKIDVAWFTTALFNHLVDTDITMFKNLHTVLVGGDTLSVDHINALKNTYESIQLINGYGPTENTTFTTTHLINKLYKKAVPIGRPVAHTNIYIVNDWLQLQPIGAPGELLFGGDGLARAYLNRDDLNQEKFIDHIFQPQGKLYRSGDVGYWTEAGVVEFLGRRDNQVKIRGYRIELGEIETAIRALEYIDDCVVIVDQKKQNKELVVYYTSTSVLQTSKLKQLLYDVLPVYMIPKYWMPIEEMPITLNGKVDKRCLPAYVQKDVQEVIQPQNAIQRGVLDAVKELLKLNQLSELSGNFFELGGDSLKVAGLIHLMESSFDVRLSYKDVMRAENLKDIADLIEANQLMLTPRVKGDPSKKYPLMGMQHSMLMYQLRYPDSTTYNMSAAYEILGELDTVMLIEALKKALKRHLTFETRLLEDEDYYQVFVEHEPEIEVISLDGQLHELIKPFDMIGGPLYRIKLIQESAYQNYLFIDIHHIIADGLSIHVLLEDVMKAYKGMDLEMKTMYCDYLEWQKNYRSSEKWTIDEAFWNNQLKGYKDYNLYSKDSHTTKNEHILIIDKQAIDQLAKTYRKTSANIFLACYTYLISDLIRSNDVAIAFPVSTRDEVKSDMVGLMINTVVLRTTVQHNISFQNYLEIISEQVIDILNHKNYPIDEVKNNFDDLNTLLGIFYSFEDQLFDSNQLILEGLNTHQVDITQHVLKSKLSLVVKAFEDRYELHLTHDLKHLSSETGRGLMISMEKLIHTILNKGEMTMNDDLIVEGKVKYDMSLVEKLKQCVDSRGHQVAIRDEKMTMTYSSLWQEALIYGDVIQSQTDIGDVIGLYLDRSAKTIAVMLGALMVGRVYLPLDKKLPEERLLYMTQQADAKLILFDEELSFEYSGKMMDIASCIQGTCTPIHDVSLLAYIIFTSGSTGQPKGVAIRQKSILNLVEGLSPWLSKKSMSVALLSSFVFDASIQTIYGALLNGHTLCIVPDDVKRSGEELINYYQQHDIKLSDGTPAHLRLMKPYLNQDVELPRYMMIGGEALHQSDVAPLIEINPDLLVINVYGPTECCVDSTAYVVSKNNYKKHKYYPIGSALPNYHIRIVNHDMLPVAEGITGELLIAGDGVAAGYINALSLTRERFIMLDGIRWYKTGDLVYRDDLDQIHFVGREDGQVKVNGYRIETGEIKAVLEKHESIKTCHVYVDDSSIVACYVGDVTRDVLHEFAGRYLAEFMMPTRWLMVNEIPLTASGKVDVNALKLIGQKTSGFEPKTDTEKKLYSMLADLLKHEDFNKEDSFFMIGGNSLKAMQLIERIRLGFGVKLSVKELFKENSFRALTEMIEAHEASAYAAIPHIDSTTYDMSSAEKRMYTLYLMKPNQTTYNMYQAFELIGEVSIEKMEEALLTLIEYHEVLRTNFVMEEGHFVQKIAPKIETFSIQSFESKDIQSAIDTFVKPFVLESDLLIRVGCATLNDGRKLLIIDMHHIISDGLSVQNMVKYLMKLMSDIPIERPKIQYKDYAQWQSAQKDSDEYKALLKTWRDHLKTSSKVDFSNGLTNNFKGKTLNMMVDEKIVSRTHDFMTNFGVTEFMFYIGVYYLVLSEVDNHSSVTIGTPVSGRYHPDIEDGLGMYINTLLLKMDIDTDKTFKDYMLSIKERVIDALENQHIQLDDIIEVLKQSGVNHELFNVLFSYETQDNDVIQLNEDLSLKPVDMIADQAKSDLTLVVLSNRRGVELKFNYAVDVIDDEFIKQFSGEYVSVLEQVLKNPMISLKNLHRTYDLRNRTLQQMDEVLEEFDGEFAF